MYILYNFIYSSLLRREAAIDWPTACDITGVPIPLTARIHQHQLPVKRYLYGTLLWSESQHTTCCGNIWHYWLTLVIMHPCALAATEHSGSSWRKLLESHRKVCAFQCRNKSLQDATRDSSEPSTSYAVQEHTGTQGHEGIWDAQAVA